MIKKLLHIGIAVKHLGMSKEIFSKIFEIAPSKSENVPGQKVNLAFYHLDGVSIELTEPTSPDAPIAKFIEKRGEGIHHLSFEVDDLEAELKRLKESGFQLVDEHPRPGAEGHLVAFLHPRSTNGVLIELSQKTI